MNQERYEIIMSLLDEAREFEKASENDDDKHYVDSECDSHQSEFEKLSNFCRIGVVSNSSNAGYILLFLLRIIIDDRYDLLDEWGDPHDIIPDDRSIDEFAVDHQITRNLYGFTEDSDEYELFPINTTPSEMDIYSLSRLKEYFTSLIH